MIGKRLTLARTSAGLSLRALAEKIDNLVSAQAISKYERDEMMPGSKVLIALARALATTETYLLEHGRVQTDQHGVPEKANFRSQGRGHC